MSMVQDFNREFFLELEERLFKPEVRRSSEELDKLLANDFTEFGSSGAVYSKNHVVEALAEEPATERSLEDFRVERLAPGVALVTYRSKRGSAGAERHFLRSSIWKLAEGRWRMIFHQGTPSRAK